MFLGGSHTPKEKIRSLEANQIACFHEKLPTVVEIAGAAGKDRLIWIAIACAGKPAAELVVVVLEIVVLYAVLPA